MAKEYALTIELPEFDEAAAYNHDRPISGLIRTQLLHLHAAENIKLAPKDRTNININHLLTERQASEYIQKVTARLHTTGTPNKRKTAPKKKPKAAPPSRKKSGKAAKAKSATKKRK